MSHSIPSTTASAASAVLEDPPVDADSSSPPDESAVDARAGFDPAKMRLAMLESFSNLVMRAIEREAQAQEQSTFRTNQDAQQTLALVRLAPGLIKLLGNDERRQTSAASAAPSAAETPAIKECPECFLCSAPPGTHWAHECPKLNSEDQYAAIFDYKTHSMYYRKDVGEPMPRLMVPIGKNVHDWIVRNRISEQEYVAQVNLKKMKETAERLVLAADSAVACAKRGNFIDAEVAANIAKTIANNTLDVLRHCNDRFNPFLPDPKPTPSKEDCHEERSQACDSDDPSDPK
jgi:hypothetical protein